VIDVVGKVVIMSCSP